jgi:hypothetical protein
MTHKVRFYEHHALTETHDYANWNDALSVARDRWNETGDVFSARTYPDHTSFNSLSDYIAALNADADWLEANPQEGCFISALTTSLDFWAKIGVRNPVDLAHSLALETYATLFKDVNGFRTRVDMSHLSLEDLNVKIDQLAEAL